MGGMVRVSYHRAHVRSPLIFVQPLIVPSLLTRKNSPLTISFSPGTDLIFDTGVPVLAGDRTETLFAAAKSTGQCGNLQLFQSGAWLLGAATVSLSEGLEGGTR